MRKMMMIGLAEIPLMLVAFVSFSSNLRAQRSGSNIPWACSNFAPEEAAKNDPEEEQEYSRSLNEFYRLWCTSAERSPKTREDAANTMTERWKKLWYRDDPFNAAFHETGSTDLLVMMAITGEVPKPLLADPAFMHDWLKDCSERCFMIYSEDESGEDRRRSLRLRNEALDHLKGKPAAKPVLDMLRTAKLEPVN